MNNVGDKQGVAIEKIDVDLFFGLGGLAFVPRKRGDPATFDLTELEQFIRDLVKREALEAREDGYLRGYEHCLVGKPSEYKLKDKMGE